MVADCKYDKKPKHLRNISFSLHPSTYPPPVYDELIETYSVTSNMHSQCTDSMTTTVPIGKITMSEKMAVPLYTNHIIGLPKVIK